MSESELDLPLPSEDEPSRWTSAVALVGIGALAILAGAGYLMWPHGRAPAQTAQATVTPVAVLGETGTLPVMAPSVARRHGKSVIRSSRDLSAGPALRTTFLDVVRRNNAKAFVGRVVRFDSINVMTAPTSQVMSVGPSQMDSVMVKLDPASSRAKAPAHLEPGEKVYLVGRLMPAPSEETIRRWGLTDQEQDRIGHRSLYIRAMVVEDAGDENAPATY